MNNPRLIFYGGVGSTTGANILLEFYSDKKKIKVLVDCGLRQGEKFAEEENFKDFIYEPSSIDYLFITHAHIDHIGRVPKLVKDGFNGKIISTRETMDLSKPMLEDAYKVFKIKHKKVLFEKSDIDKTLNLWQGFDYKEKINLEKDFFVEMIDAGHILGSSIINITIMFNGKEKKISFTGDLGNSPSPLLKDTEIPIDTDYLVMESVYGDRNHDNKDKRKDELKQIILDAEEKGGSIIIPAFSVERTQVILYEINNMIEQGEIKPLPVFIDSPLALKITEIYKKYSENFKDSVKSQIKSGDDIFDFNGLVLVSDARDSQKIEEKMGAKIIMAGSGMSEGGRVVNHEVNFLGDSNATILLVGYQSAGSLGRQLQDGNKFVYIEADGNRTNGKEKVEVKAKIKSIMGYSSHKDSDHLIEFVEKVSESRNDNSNSKLKVFCIMGEPKSSLFLVQRLRDYLDVEAIYPEIGKEYEIR